MQAGAKSWQFCLLGLSIPTDSGDSCPSLSYNSLLVGLPASLPSEFSNSQGTGCSLLPVAGGTELRMAMHAGGYRGKGETRNSEFRGF